MHCDANDSIYIDARDTYGSSQNTTDNAPSKHTSSGTGSNTYGSGSGAGYDNASTTGSGGYGSGTGTSGLNSGSGYETGASTGAGAGAGGYGTGASTGHSGHGSDTIHDSRKGPIDASSGTSGNYGSKSDTYGSNTAGGYGSSNTGSSTTNAGPHDSKLANKLDPRVDSDLGKLSLLLATLKNHNTRVKYLT